GDSSDSRVIGLRPSDQGRLHTEPIETDVNRRCNATHLGECCLACLNGTLIQYPPAGALLVRFGFCRGNARGTLEGSRRAFSADFVRTLADDFRLYGRQASCSQAIIRRSADFSLPRISGHRDRKAGVILLGICPSSGGRMATSSSLNSGTVSNAGSW